jgi:hypothetical protein
MVRKSMCGACGNGWCGYVAWHEDAFEGRGNGRYEAKGAGPRAVGADGVRERTL